MIGALDPALFLTSDRARRTDAEVRRDLDAVLQICRQRGVELVATRACWDRLWDELGRTLERSLRDPLAKRSVQQMRRAARVLDDGQDAPRRAWGFRQMFAWEGLGGGWEDMMSRSIARLAREDHEIILFTRLLETRNLTTHSHANTSLREITRWRLYLTTAGVSPVTVRCIHHRRNLDVAHTERIDHRLPADADRAQCPYCPPARWHQRDTRVFAHVQSRPVWLDRHGNAWARPSIGGGKGHHWDVYLRAPDLADQIGLDQINITAWGAPASEGEPGDLHHLPSNKRAHLKREPRWRC